MSSDGIDPGGFFPDDPLRMNYGEIMPERSPDWDTLTAYEKAMWLRYAKRTLIVLVRLFRPAYVSMAYYRPYMAEVCVSSQEAGNILLGAVNLLGFK